MAGNDASAAVADPDGLGLGNQIADSEYQAIVADDDAVPRPLGAQRLGGEGVGWNDRLDADDRGQRLVEVIVVVVRTSVARVPNLSRCQYRRVRLSLARHARTPRARVVRLPRGPPRFASPTADPCIVDQHRPHARFRRRYAVTRSRECDLTVHKAHREHTNGLAVRLSASHRRLRAVCRAGRGAHPHQGGPDGRHGAQAADRRHGIRHSAGVLLVVGLLRVFYFEKGATYYFHTWTFIAKLALFVIIGLVSIVPTLEFLAWRKAVKQGQAPSVSPERVRSLRSIIHWELVGIVLIILMAALMAKGVGLLL